MAEDIFKIFSGKEVKLDTITVAKNGHSFSFNNDYVTNPTIPTGLDGRLDDVRYYTGDTAE